MLLVPVVRGMEVTVPNGTAVTVPDANAPQVREAVDGAFKEEKVRL